MKATRYLPLLFFAVVASSCDRRANLESADFAKIGHVSEAGASYEVAAVSTQAYAPPSATSVFVERKMIRNGILTIEVSDIVAVKPAIEKICKEANAYLASETQNNYGHRRQYEQVIRVPGANFDELVKKLEVIGSVVEAKSIQTTDVTAEFIDTEARIKAKKALEDRYLDILRKATAIKDMLEIEDQLTNVRTDIESMEGRLKYLSNQVEYSTLSLTFYQPLKNDYGFGDKLTASLAGGWDMLLAFFIGALSLWPFIVLIGAIIYVVIRRIRNRQSSLVES